MPQMSLRTLLVATAIIPIAFYLLIKANAVLAGIAILLAFAAWIGLMIVGLTDKGKRGAFAGGALAALTIYAGIVLAEEEFTLKESKLFTSGLLYHAHEACVTRTMSEVEILSPETVLFSPPIPETALTMTGESPTPEHFAIVGHVYWGILFGIIGGLVARWMVPLERKSTASRLTNEPGATQTAP